MANNGQNVHRGFKVDENGQVDLSYMVPILNRFQSDGIDYLWDLEPQSQNLFFVGEFVEAGTSKDTFIRAFWNAAYRIKSISIKGPEFTYKMDSVTKIPKLESVSYPQEVTIEWHEDVYHSTQKYHSDWMSRWYNRQFDVLRCGLQGKFRRCRVIAFHYVNGRDVNDTNLIEVPEVQPILCIDMGGMCPKGMGDFKFDYGADQNDATVTISYHVAKMALYYHKDLAAQTKDARNKIWGSGSTGNQGTSGLAYINDIKTWSPKNYEQDAGHEASDQELEKLRIAKQTTSWIVDEATIG